MQRMFAILASWAIACNVAMADEITVLSGGAIEPGLHGAVAAFEKETGHRVKVTFNTMPQIVKRISDGDKFDVVIVPPQAIDGFAKEQKLGADRISVGRVGLGVTVRPGAPTPDIANVDGRKRAVLEADSLVFNQASTGIYFENLLKKLGIYDQVAAKTTRYPDGASVMEHVLKGKGKEIGFGAITEILIYRERGLRLVGPLPADVQNYTTYNAAPMIATANHDLAQTFIRYLGSPAGKKHFVAAGIE